jgi:hypothetical protein
VFGAELIQERAMKIERLTIAIERLWSASRAGRLLYKNIAVSKCHSSRAVALRESKNNIKAHCKPLLSYQVLAQVTTAVL